MKKTKFKKTEIGMIPEDWEVKTISQVAEVVGGGTPSTKNLEYWNGKISWLTPKDLSNYKFKYIEKGERSITEEGLNNSSAKLLPKNTVLLTTRAPVGYIAISSREVCTNQGFRSLVPKTDETDHDFLYYLLKLKTDYLKSQAFGSTFGELSGTTLKNLKFAFPPLPEQRAIAKILSDLDAKIELLQKQNETLEKIGQVIFKHWFVDFEFPNEEGKPYKSSGGEMVYNEELGKEIPKEWSVGSLGDGILTRLIKSGINNFDSEKIYLDTASVQDTNIIDFSTRITINKRPSRANMQPIPKSVWFAKMKNSKKVLLIDEYDKFILNKVILSTGFAGIETLKNSEYYIWNIINSDNFEKIKDSLCLGTTMQAINNENIKKIKYLIPQYELLIKFNNFVKENYKKISINKQQIQILQQIRDSLLPKLMTGKIRVPVEVIK